MLFLDFSSQNIYKLLNQEGFSRQVKIIVLFSEKNMSKLSEFLLETKIIIILHTSLADYFACFKLKTHLILTFFLSV